MELKPLYLFLVAFIVIMIGIVVIQQSASNAELIDLGTELSSEYILSDNGTANSLAQTPTSLSATRLNQTWLEFDGVDDYSEVGLSVPNFNNDSWMITMEVMFSNDTKKEYLWALGSDIENNTIGLRIQDTKVDLRIINSTGAGSTTTFGNLNTTLNKSWYTLVVRKKQADRRVYVSYNNNNGYSIGALRNISKEFSSFSNLTIGALVQNSLLNNFSTHNISNFKLYNYSSPNWIINEQWNRNRFGNDSGIGISLVYYHTVKTVNDIAVFTTHMDALNESGYTTITEHEYWDWRINNTPISDKTIFIGFDDGSESVFTNATPVMDKYGYVGTISINTGTIGDSGKMNWTQVQNLSDKGWGVSSHTVNHVNMSALTTAQRAVELNQSKWEIYGNISVMPKYFVFPYNIRNETMIGECLGFYDFCSGGDAYTVPKWIYQDTSVGSYSEDSKFWRMGLSASTDIDLFRGRVLVYPYQLVDLKLNENQGTTAYDVSGNGNNGTILGATWNNDGVNLSLTSEIDYNLSTNIFTIINDEYAWDQVYASYEYTTDANSTSSTIAHLIEIFVALAILSFILLIINYYMKQIE